MTLKASSGELDFSVYYLDLKDMAVFKENEAKGNYRTLLPKSLRTSDLGLFFNRTVKGEELEKLFNTKDFRIALSIALNRKKMETA